MSRETRYILLVAINSDAMFFVVSHVTPNLLIPVVQRQLVSPFNFPEKSTKGRGCFECRNSRAWYWVRWVCGPTSLRFGVFGEIEKRGEGDLCQVAVSFSLHVCPTLLPTSREFGEMQGESPPEIE
jgi:hypothetical protein